MRHVYVTLQHEDLLPELLIGDFDALREPFRFLLHDECLTWLVENGAGPIDIYRADDMAPLRAHLPFVSHLGGLRKSPGSQSAGRLGCALRPNGAAARLAGPEEFPAC